MQLHLYTCKRIPDELEEINRDSRHRKTEEIKTMKMETIKSESQLPVGKTIRVKLTEDGIGASIIAIGHIIKDDWFSPATDFKKDEQ
jgi:hypothetical protein